MKCRAKVQELPMKLLFRCQLYAFDLSHLPSLFQLLGAQGGTLGTSNPNN